MWQCPDEPEDELEDESPVADCALNGPDTDLVLELVSDYVQSAMFTTLARVDKRFAAKARLLFDAFLDQLAATSQRLGKRSAERNKTFWKQYREDRNAFPTARYALSYEDRAEWHYWNDAVEESDRRGAGTCEDIYGNTMPTRDQVFSDKIDRRDFELALALARKPNNIHNERKSQKWNKRHALCAPFFVHGPINFFKRMAISHSGLYDVVVHGDASGVKTEGFGHRHHRFFVKRLLEEREAS